MQNLSKKKIDDLQMEVMSNCVNVKKKNFKRGEYILSFGLHQKVLGVIGEGKADIIRIDVDGNISVIKKLIPGSVFNDAFSCYSKDSAFVISKSDTEIFFIDYMPIFKDCPIACKYHSHMVQMILDFFTENSISLNEKIEILSYTKIRDRILSYISFATNASDSLTISLHFSYAELAEYLCVDRASLMRELKKMEEEHIIKRDKKTITLLDVSHY